MKVHVVTRADVTPGSIRRSPGWPVGRAAARGAALAAHPRSVSGAPLNCVMACSSWMRATISSPRRRGHAVGAELLHVEGREHGGVGHRAAQQLVGELLAGVGRDVADKPPANVSPAPVGSITVSSG